MGKKKTSRVAVVSVMAHQIEMANVYVYARYAYDYVYYDVHAIRQTYIPRGLLRALEVKDR